MKLERAHEYVTTTVAILVGIFMAYVFGKLAGGGRFGLISVMLALSAFGALLLALKEHVWLLIPISLPLLGRIEEIVGHPAIKDVTIVLVFGGIFALRAFKLLRRKPTYEAIDFWLLVMLLYLLTVFVRNPVGGDALGSSRVGGRPYLDVFIAGLGFLVLARMSLPINLAKRVFYLTAGLACLSTLGTITQIFAPVTSPVLGRIFGAAGEEAADTGAVDPEMIGRKTYLAGLGSTINLGLISAYPTLSLFNPLYFVRCAFFGAGILCTLFSGFRSGLVGTAAFFLLATYLRYGSGKVIRLCILGGIGLGLLVLMQGTVLDLPLSIQRSLSFLPGDWNRTATADAQFSSDWRFFMWEQMLKTDRYIESKVLGDGFGMTSMQLQQVQSTFSYDDPMALQESFMISGTVHSGPIGTIKFVGYVGLGIFLIVLGVLARDAWKMCREAEGTAYYSYALFLGLPLIYLPFSFIFVFGAYDSDLPRVLIGAGLTKMLRTSIRLHRASEEEAAAQLPLTSYDPLAGARHIPAHLQF